MARKIKEDKNNTFVDEVSGISYKWLKEEVEPANGISCWSAKDQWGNKDYFVVREGAIIKGPYRTVKETVKALEEGLEDNIEAEDEVEVDIAETTEVEDKANLGIMNELRQASNQVTEVIRRCEELKQWSDEAGKDEIINVLQSIIEEENENIGKIQAMLKALSPENEKIEDGEEEAKEIMDDDVFGDDTEDIFTEDFGITPALFTQLKSMGTTPVDEIKPTMNMNANTFAPKATVSESVEDVDTAQIMRERFGTDDVVDCDIIGF